MSTTTTTTAPVAPSALPQSNNSDTWTPLAIIGIVASIMVLLLCVPLIAICLRRYERKRCKETVKNATGSPRGGSSRESDDLDLVEEGHSLKNIWVTKEMQRISLKLSRPETAHMHGRKWSGVEAWK